MTYSSGIELPRALWMISAVGFVAGTFIGCQTVWDPIPVAQRQLTETERSRGPVAESAARFPVPVLRRTSVVEVWAAGGDDLGRIRIQVKPSAGRSAVTLDLAAPAGDRDSWQASVGMAATVAARMLGRSVRDYAIHVEVGQGIDRAAAEALLTAGTMAAMTRAPVRAHAIIVGSVKPDGGMAPVPNLAKHLRVVSSGVVGSFGYPEGQRVYAAARTLGRGDLEGITLKKTLSVESLASVYDAYRLLTGRRIQLPVPLAVEQMSLTVAQREAYQARTQRLLEWSRRALQRARGPRRDLATSVLAKHVEGLWQDIRATRSMLDRGQLASAAKTAADVFGQAMAVAETSDWLADHAGDPVEQLRALSAWLFYPGHYVRILGSVVFSARGIAQGNLAVCQLLDAFRAHSQVQRSLSHVGTELRRSAGSPGRVSPHEQLVFSDPHSLVRQVLPQLIRGYGKIRSARALDPLLAMDRTDALLSAGSVETTAAALLADAEARLAVAELVARRPSVARRASLFELVRPKEIEGVAERLINVRNLAAHHTVALSSAWVSLARTSRMLYQVHAQAVPATARVGAEYAARFARTLASSAKTRLGYVPPEAQFHYALAQEAQARGKFARAETLFDLSALDSRLAVMLDTAQRRHVRQSTVGSHSAQPKRVPLRELTYDHEARAALATAKT